MSNNVPRALRGLSDEPNSAGENGRRNFLKMLLGGAGVATAATMATGCDFIFPGDDDGEMAGSVNLGSGDVGILNYAFALEQLEAAFYTVVADNWYSGATQMEKDVLMYVRDHEIAHREFFKAALGSNGIPGLKVNFSTIDFSSRSSVLGTARTFEDLGVSAYNGAGPLLEDAGYLTAAGKIVSVEARHAAAIRDMITPKSPYSLGEDIMEMGLDVARSPKRVLKMASPYILNPINANNLPSSNLPD